MKRIEIRVGGGGAIYGGYVKLRTARCLSAAKLGGKCPHRVASLGEKTALGGLRPADPDPKSAVAGNDISERVNAELDRI